MTRSDKEHAAKSQAPRLLLQAVLSLRGPKLSVSTVPLVLLQLLQSYEIKHNIETGVEKRCSKSVDNICHWIHLYFELMDLDIE